MTDLSGASVPPPKPAAPPTGGNTNALGAGLGTDMSPLINQRLAVGQKEAQGQTELGQMTAAQKVREAQGSADVAGKVADAAHQQTGALDQQLQENPLPTYIPTQDNAQDIASMFGIIGVIGSVLGAAGGGKQSGLTAMGAMTGMLDGWQQGKKDLYEKNRADFEESLKDMEAKQKALIDAYNRNLALLPYDAAKANSEMQIDLAKFSSPLIAKQFQVQGWDALGKTIDSLINAQSKLDDLRVKALMTTAKNMPTMTPDAVHLAAQMWLTTGQLPNLGFGGAADRSAIIEEGSNIAASLGLNVNDILSGRVQYKADQASINNLQKMSDTTDAFEQTMLRNIDIIKKNLSEGVGSDWGTLVNRYIQYGRQSIEGDPSVNQLEGSIVTVMDEYAKILSGNTTGGAASTDAARAQAGALMSQYSNAATILGVINNVIYPDAQNRLNGYRSQLAQMRARVGTLTPPKAPAESKPQPTQADRDYVKSHPETRQDFIDHFGVEP